MQILISGIINYQKATEKLDFFSKNKQQLIWILEHNSIFTAGKSSQENHILDKNIHLAQTNRGGQITYHSPGQIICYFAYNLQSENAKNQQINSIFDFINKLENTIINLLKDNFNLDCQTNPKNRGIFINNQKIASIGLRISKNFITHGISINVNNDLTPFQKIIPCGLENIQQTSLQKLEIKIPTNNFKYLLLENIKKSFI